MRCYADLIIRSETDKGRNGDSAWTLWGLAMRIVQAVGTSRDRPTLIVSDGVTSGWREMEPPAGSSGRTTVGPHIG